MLRLITLLWKEGLDCIKTTNPLRIYLRLKNLQTMKTKKFVFGKYYRNNIQDKVYVFETVFRGCYYFYPVRILAVKGEEARIETNLKSPYICSKAFAIQHFTEVKDLV